VVKFRENGIGGSEQSAVLSMNPYKSSMRVYAEKTGYVQAKEVKNEATYHGTHQEAYVKDFIWQYHDGTEDGYINQIPQRTYRNIPAYAVNPKYPHLFASVDGLIDKGQATLDGEILVKDGILEAKTINGMYAKMWDSGVPIYYIIQVMHYLIVYGLEYGEIVSFIDGRKASLYSVSMDTELAEKIVSASSQFWNERVVPGKKVVEEWNKAKKSGEKLDQLQEEIDRLMPPPDSSDDCKLFLKEIYRTELDSMIGDSHTYSTARRVHLLNRMIAVLTTEKTYCNNILQEKFVKQRVEKLTFDDKGYIKFTKRGNSELPSLHNGVSKDGIDSDLAKHILSKTEIF